MVLNSKHNLDFNFVMHILKQKIQSKAGNNLWYTGIT